MTKQRYFEMCEMLGSEPVEEEIPVESEDLAPEIQQCIYVYNLLQDTWEYMGGNYTGKNMSNFWKLMELDNIPKCDIKYYYEIVMHLDQIRTDYIRKLKEAKEKPAK